MGKKEWRKTFEFNLVPILVYHGEATRDNFLAWITQIFRNMLLIIIFRDYMVEEDQTRPCEWRSEFPKREIGV